MDNIGKIAGMVAAQAKTLPVLQSDAPRLPSAAFPPTLCVPETDIDLPRRLFSTVHCEGKPREIVRALTDGERSMVEARAASLMGALRPFAEVDEPDIEADIAAALSGFRAAAGRMQGQAGLSAITITKGVLAPFPAWAIRKACMRIARGEAGLDPRFAPNDAQICELVREVIEPYRQTLATVTALLAAPVATPILRQPPPRRAIDDGRVSPGHTERVAADLAAKKATREGGGAPPAA